MSLHTASSAVVRFPPRLRVVPKGKIPTSAFPSDPLVANGIRAENPGCGSDLHPLASSKTAGGFALDALLSAGTIDGRQLAASV